jgi:hypothetical protein
VTPRSVRVYRVRVANGAGVVEELMVDAACTASKVSIFAVRRPGTPRLPNGGERWAHKMRPHPEPEKPGDQVIDVSEWPGIFAAVAREWRSGRGA